MTTRKRREAPNGHSSKRIKVENSEITNNYATFQLHWSYLENTIGIRDIELIIFDYWMQDAAWQVCVYKHSNQNMIEQLHELVFSDNACIYNKDSGVYIHSYHLDAKTHEILWDGAPHPVVLDQNIELFNVSCLSAFPGGFLVLVYHDGSVLYFVNLQGKIEKELVLTKDFYSGNFTFVPHVNEIYIGEDTHTAVFNTKTGNYLRKIDIALIDKQSFSSHELLWGFVDYKYLGAYSPKEQKLTDENLGLRVAEIQLFADSKGGTFQIPMIDSWNMKWLVGSNNRLYGFYGSQRIDPSKTLCLVLDTSTLPPKIIEIIPFQLEYNNLDYCDWFESVYCLDDNHILYMNDNGYAILSFTSPSLVCNLQ